MKNIVIFHLESLNSNFFFTNRHLFPNLNKLISQSTYYTNYYSTATSTFMVVSDLLYGTSYNFEESRSLEGIYNIIPRTTSLLSDLEEKGYNVSCLCYSKKADFGEKKDVNDFNALIGSTIFTKVFEDREEFALGVDEKTVEPFCQYIQAYESHISEIDTYKCSKNMLPEDLLLARYSQLDETLGVVLNTIYKKNFQKNTYILLYGDHGDELLLHALHEGLTHAIEPYFNMIHCPLIVYNPDCAEEKISNKLISTVELKSIILDLLNSSDSCFESPKYVYSRNLYKGQALRNGFFNKSYSVTNGNYQLMVSSKGLRIYTNKLDLIGLRNLLDFFTFRRGKLEYDKAFDVMKSTHFKNFMTDMEKKEIVSQFYELHKALKEYIDSLYGRYNSKMDFDKIDYTIGIKNERNKFKIRFCLRCVKSFIKKIIGYQK